MTSTNAAGPGEESQPVTPRQAKAPAFASEEATMMHYTTLQALGQARLADLHHQAQRDALARAARRARRRNPPHLAAGLMAVLTRRPRRAGEPVPAPRRRYLHALAGRRAAAGERLAPDPAATRPFLQVAGRSRPASEPAAREGYGPRAGAVDVRDQLAAPTSLVRTGAGAGRTRRQEGRL